MILYRQCHISLWAAGTVITLCSYKVVLYQMKKPAIVIDCLEKYYKLWDQLCCVLCVVFVISCNYILHNNYCKNVYIVLDIPWGVVIVLKCSFSTKFGVMVTLFLGTLFLVKSSPQFWVRLLFYFYTIICSKFATKFTYCFHVAAFTADRHHYENNLIKKLRVMKLLAEQIIQLHRVSSLFN